MTVCVLVIAAVVTLVCVEVPPHGSAQHCSSTQTPKMPPTALWLLVPYCSLVVLMRTNSAAKAFGCQTTCVMRASCCCSKLQQPTSRPQCNWRAGEAAYPPAAIAAVMPLASFVMTAWLQRHVVQSGLQMGHSCATGATCNAGLGEL